MADESGIVDALFDGDAQPLVELVETFIAEELMASSGIKAVSNWGEGAFQTAVFLLLSRLDGDGYEVLFEEESDDGKRRGDIVIRKDDESAAVLIETKYAQTRSVEYPKRNSKTPWWKAIEKEKKAIEKGASRDFFAISFRPWNKGDPVTLQEKFVDEEREKLASTALALGAEVSIILAGIGHRVGAVTMSN